MLGLLFLLLLIGQISLGIQDGQSSAFDGEHFDLKIHYRPLQTTLFERLNEVNAFDDETLDRVKTLLIKKLSDVLKLNGIKISIYDFTLVGEELKLPTLIVHAECSLNEQVGRRELSRRLSFQSELLVPYIQKIDRPSQIVSGDYLTRVLQLLVKKPEAPPSCQNGGILLPNGTCSCQSYFGGDDCSIVLCKHQGLSVNDIRCLCAPEGKETTIDIRGYGIYSGWIGKNCETLPTLAPSLSSFDFSTRTLVVALNNIISTALDIQQTMLAIENYFNKTSPERQSFYKNFILLTFVQFGDNYIEVQSESSNYKDFIQKIASVHPLEGDDTQPILTALQTSIIKSRTTLPKSTVIMVIDRLASDASPGSNNETSATPESNLLKTSFYWQHSINIVLTQRSDEQRSDNPGDSYNSLKRVSQHANGEFVDMGKTKIKVDQAISAVLQAQFKAETISVQRDADFSGTLTFQLPTAKDSQLYVSGKDFQLKDSNDAVINPTFNAGVFALYPLSSSQWTLKLVAGSNASPKISYRAVIEVDNQAFMAYTYNKVADATAAYPVAQIDHYVVLNGQNYLTSAKVSGVSASDSNKEVFGQIDLEQRTIDSNFPFIGKTPINCTAGPFWTKIQYTAGNDEIQLLISSFCFEPDHHSNYEHQNTCSGHGTWDDEKKKCICKKYFSGDNCQNVLCLNGGTVNDFPKDGDQLCFCYPGFEGVHCESMICKEEAKKPNFSQKSLSVVLQRSYSQAFLNPEIQDAVKAALDSIRNAHGDYFTDFVLTTFVSAVVKQDPEIQTQTFSKSDDLITALDAANIKYAITRDTEQSSFRALLDTLQVPKVETEQGRLIFLFVDAPPKNPDLIAQIKDFAFRHSISLDIFITAPYGPDGLRECMNSKFIDIYLDLSRSTSGVFINLCQTFVTGSVKNFFGGFLGASYRYQASRKETSDNCNAEIPVKIGDGTTMRYFLVDADKSTTFNASFVTSDEQAVGLVQLGQLDTVVFYQATNLEQKDYKLKVSVSNPTNCRITIAQESDFHISAGFAENPSIDFSNVTIMFGHPSHPVIYLSTQFQSTANISLSVKDKSGGGYNDEGIIRQSNCTFEYYFMKPLSCSINDGPFDLQAIITTNDGIYTERALFSHCDKLDTNCLNGGTYSDSKCHCTPQYSGDYCENPVCVHGRAFETECVCDSGFAGPRCENILCTKWDFLEMYDSNTFEYQSVVFAVQNDLSSEDANKELINGIQEFVNNLQKAQKQIKHYSLITFDDKNVENIISTVDITLFVSTFTDKLNNPTQKRVSKARSLYSMQLATEISVYRPAIIYVFINAGPSFGGDNPAIIMEALSLGGAQINVICTQTKGPGNSDYYKRVTTASNGRYVWVTKDDIKPLLVNYFPSTVFENALILDEFKKDCNKGSEYSFPVESRIKWIAIVIRGLNANQNVKLTDDNGDVITPNVIISDDATYIGTVNQSSIGRGGGGTKKIYVKTKKDECSLQIYASSELHAEIGFTLDLHDDFPNERPTVVSANNGSTYLTVRIGRSLTTVNVAPSHVQLLSRDLKTGQNTLLAESDIIQRDNAYCANQYISDLLIVPIGTYKVDGTPLLVKITGKEGDTDTFQRLRLYFPEPIKCQNGATHNQYGYCECPPDYEGDDCTIPRCRNGGTVDSRVCACGSGFHGKLCELVVS